MLWGTVLETVECLAVSLASSTPEMLVAQSCLTLCDPTNYPWESPGKNTGVDCRSLLQRIFLTQGSNSGLLHCRQLLYHLSYREDLRYTIVMEISLRNWHFKLVVHSFVEKKINVVIICMDLKKINEFKLPHNLAF